MATLLDMTITHVPVLAGELIDALDPQPGEIVVDCTAGGGGHARLVAERIGAGGTLIGIDRDQTAGERFAELAREVSATTRAPFAFKRAGQSRAVSWKWPRWFVASWSSNPRGLFANGTAMMPALLMRR